MEEIVQAYVKKRREGGRITWIEELVKPLAQELARAKHINHVEVWGPFGLRNETSIWLFQDDERDVLDQEHWTLQVMPGNLGEGQLLVDTGEKRNDYQDGTLGAINHMDNVTKPLPMLLEDIIPLLQHNEAQKKEMN